ncbi:proton-coupled folate transporter-like isoform X1 [Topomyia yanbarensis]|uniref:proton-coupled folate transporter-like isoform X1 n=1 Tax=Topomyia yanbarensis TaxID=2498891 RepID=UPI00273B236F|nr:proton-coupled folate transporter-like isoform X1 [Topomyia yanbarensis]
MDSEGSKSNASINSNEGTPLLHHQISAVSSSASSSEVEITKKTQCLTLELVAVALSFGWSISGIVLANQIIFQTCVYLGYNESLCLLLGTNANSTEIANLETAVQPTVAKISMASNILISVVPALCGLFMGPWSDRFGRKPVMMIPCIGYFITYICKTAICHFSSSLNLSPWLYVAAFIPAAITGGTSVVCAGMFSFLTDITTEQNRTVRMGILQACTLAGAFLGMMSSSFILAWTNASTVFLISASTMLFATFYVKLVIVDSVSRRQVDQFSGNCAKLREIFRLDLLKDMFITFFKARSGYDRGIIWLTVAIAAFTVLGSRGSDVFYLYTRKKFNWTLEDFTLWQSADFLSIIIGNFLGITILKKLFKLPDIAIAFLSVLSFTSDSFIKGMATSGWQLYMSTGVTPLKGTEGAAMMAISSSILPSHDIAKIYSMAISVTAMVPLAASPLFTYIYSQTLATAPEVFNFVASGIFSVNVLFVGELSYWSCRARFSEGLPVRITHYNCRRDRQCRPLNHCLRPIAAGRDS